MPIPHRFASSGGEPETHKSAKWTFNLTRWAAILIATLAVGYFYAWAVRAAGPGFQWGRDLNGFYDYLGRSFAEGRLSMPFAPDPRLLALPNPWDPSAGNEYKVFDLVLYNRRYYLYHGAGPAAMLFTPWRILTGHDLPENFAVFLLSFGGFLFSCGLLLRLLKLTAIEPDPALLATLLLALGLCQGIPYLLNRVFVYEVAIAGGYFCISAALFFLALAVPSGKAYQFAASGLMFGLAISCRPNLVFASGTALAALAVFLPGSRHVKQVVAFLVPLCAIGIALALYNYARFGNPFEFGVNHLLGGDNNQNRIKLSMNFILPSLYFFLACAPRISPVFPWLQLVIRYPFNNPDTPFPVGYFIEPIAGALFLAPFIAVAFLVPLRDRFKRADPSHFHAARMLLWTTFACSIAVLLSVAWTGFTTQRYEIDFLPGLVLVALVNMAFYIDRGSGYKRRLLGGLLAVLVVCSAVVNLSLGVSGPYDGILKEHPRRYMHLANWFSFNQQLRPLLNPYVSVAFTAQLTSQPAGFRDPLVTLGSHSYTHFVYLEHGQGRFTLGSRASDGTTLTREFAAPPDRTAKVEISYAPDSGNLISKVDGETLVHHIPALLTAPSEVTVGENRIDGSQTAPRYTGTIHNAQMTVHATRN